jgi:hypothetical protein
MSVTVSGGRRRGGGTKFLPLYTSTFLLDRVSQKDFWETDILRYFYYKNRKISQEK